MKQILLLAGAAALAFAAPALAKPGNGRGNGNSYALRNGPAYGINGPFGYGAGGCPPGLAKKTPSCVPPGQAKKLYSIGQRLPLGYGTPYGFGQIPYSLRAQYGLSPYGSYYYGNGYLYQVDPRTMLIQQVVGALLR